MENEPSQIAIDGPAASGKSTVARTVADRLDACYVNTGEMYRTLTWVVLRESIDPETQTEAIEGLLETIDISYRQAADGELVLMLDHQPVDLEQIRAPQVTEQVSTVSKIPAVREWMVERQRASAERGLIVMEGRDIGTVVLPDASFKFFITATPYERARRRLAQGSENVDGATLESVAHDIAERDRIDSTREISPLKAADDAITIDTTGMSIQAVVEQVMETIRLRNG